MTLQASSQGINWFQDARFGMFIHWGLYSILGRGEWVMHNEQIPAAEYEKLAGQFNPVRFNADEWVSIAADAGQKYMVITSRHHDGFSMYNTALSGYKVTATPFKRDPLAELAAACARRGDVKLGFYSSLLDWHHPAYRFRAESGLAWADYLEFLHGQVRELCTNFGELACLWFDGDWPHHKLDESNAYFAPGGSFEYERLYAMIHELQPHAVVMNNRHEKPLPGEDVQGFEQDLPGMNSAGFNATTVYDLPLEVCMTINDNWGFSRSDHNHKSVRRLVHLLARSAAAGANLLLNVGPTPEGEILPVHADRLKKVGAWLRDNGRSIYGTRPGGLPPSPVSVSTRRGGTTYLHILDYVSDSISMEAAPASDARARLVRDGTRIEYEADGARIRLTLREEDVDPSDTVIEINA